MLPGTPRGQLGLIGRPHLSQHLRNLADERRPHRRLRVIHEPIHSPNRSQYAYQRAHGDRVDFAKNQRHPNAGAGHHCLLGPQ